MATPVERVQGKHPRQGATKAVIASGLGNVMEWYDFGIYGYFAPVLSSLFFPRKVR